MIIKVTVDTKFAHITFSGTEKEVVQALKDLGIDFEDIQNTRVKENKKKKFIGKD